VTPTLLVLALSSAVMAGGVVDVVVFLELPELELTAYATPATITSVKATDAILTPRGLR
jgi:hypothetical protein